MSFLYWIFGVEASLRQSMPSLSVHDEGFSRGWIFVLSLFFLSALLWMARTGLPGLKFRQAAVLALSRWVFFLLLFFMLVHPVLVLAGEEVQGLPEIEKVDLSASPWILVLMLLLLCLEWWFRRSWRLK